MRRLYVGLIVVSTFLLFYIILPRIFYALHVESIFLYALFDLLSFILVPIFMFKSMEFIPAVKQIAVAFFIISIASFLASLTAYGSYAWLNFFLGLSLYLVVLIIFFFFVVGLTLEPSYYFRRRVGIALVAISFLLILKYSSILYIIYLIAIDTAPVLNITWDLSALYLQLTIGVSVLYSLFGYLALDSILFERDKYA